MIEEVEDSANQMNNRDMDIHIETKEIAPAKELPPPPMPVPEKITPSRSESVRQAPKPPSPPPKRLRDKEIIIIEREGGNITKNINISIDTALEEGMVV